MTKLTRISQFYQTFLSKTLLASGNLYKAVANFNSELATTIIDKEERFSVKSLFLAAAIINFECF